jgi:iron complex outermembrane receptor protein
MTAHHRPLLLATTVLAGCLALPAQNAAHAQEADDGATVLETITVTARKRKEDIRNVPASIDVETAESLEEKRALDGQAVMRDVSGASVGTFGDRSNGFIVMRGVAPILTPLSPDDSSVLTFIDGAPLALGGSFSSSYLDLDRVEILKGPQNTLFGRNTSGGAINLIPAEPTHDFHGSVRGEFGNDGIYRTETMLNGSLIPDVLAGRIALRRSSIDGYIDNIAGDDLGAEDNWVGRASLLFTPTEDTRWLLSVQGEDSDMTPTTYIALRPGEAKLAAQNHTIDDTQLATINSRLEHDFEAMTFTAQTSFTKLKNRNVYNYPDAFIAHDFSGLPLEDFLDPDTNFIGWTKRDTRLSQEFRLSSLPDSDIGWLAGVSLYQDRARRHRPVEMWYFGPSATGEYFYDQTTTGQAIFGEITYPVLERFNLSVGARATHEKKTFDGSFFSDGTAGAVKEFHEDGEQSYGFATGRAALSYEWSDELTTYASVSRGFKSGGYAVENSLMWAGVPRNPYDSSSIMSYEVGAKSAWLDNRLKLNAALFFNDMSKEQMQTWDYMTFTGRTFNLDARSYGFELDGDYDVTGNWTLSGGLGYTFSEVRNVPAEVTAAQDRLVSGNWLPTVPRWTARAAVQYQAEGSELGFEGALAETMFNARLAYNYTGKRYTDASNTGELEPAHVVSARLGVDWGGGEAYLFGDNLIGKQYMTIKDRFGMDPSGTSTVFGVSYARGRTFGAGITLRF